MGNHKRSGGGILLNIVVCLAIVLTVFFILGPVFLPHGHGGYSTCECNMKLIGNAIKMYLSDWDDHYPTNRPYISGHKLGPVSAYVKLTDLQPTSNSTAGHQYGKSWVEALYRYVESVTRSNDSVSVFRCPEAKGPGWPENFNTAVVSYALNANMVEMSENEIRGPASLMMLRELDRPTGSALRPANNTTWTSKSRPLSPFLTGSDRYFGKTRSALHGNGSHILFSDGHVKVFSRDFFTPDDKITKERYWDPKSGQWYNYGPGAKDVPMQYIKSIAITP